MIKVNKWLYYFILVVIIILSFSLHSSQFYPLLNSDDALNILMAHSYQLPDNLYCWGQNRGGTLISLIASAFIKLIGLTPVMSVSLANYLILILGYFAFSSFFKSKFTRLVFAIAWFLPPITFADLTRFPIGVQYSLIGMALYLISKINFKDKKLRSHLLMVGVISLFTISIWVFSISLVTIIIIIVTLYLFYATKYRKVIPPKEVIFYIVLGSLLCYLFIRYAKSFSPTSSFNYLAINTPRMLWFSLTYIFGRMFNLLIYNPQEPFLCVYAWLILLLTVSIIVALIKKKIIVPEEQKKWLVIFFIDMIVMFSGMMMSRWVYINYIGNWYFVTTYISILLIILLLVENLNIKKSLLYTINIVALIIVVIGGISTFYFLKYVNPKTLRSQMSIQSELLTLEGDIGIIANYWNAYISAIPDPDRIKATPHENGGARNNKLLYEVFNQPHLYVIRDEWMDFYPDTLQQYGFLLLKKGDPFFIANREMQEYVRLKRSQTFPLNSLVLLTEHSEEDSISMFSGESVVLNYSATVITDNISIAPGEYTMEYELSLTDYDKEGVVATFEISAENGEVMIAHDELTSWEIENPNLYVVKIDFSTNTSYNGLRSRIHSTDGTTLVLSAIRIKEK